MEIISKADAKAKGLNRYFTGRPCAHGHVAERCTSDMHCTECDRASGRKHYHANRKRLREALRDYYRANRERRRKYAREHDRANRGRMNAYSRAYELAKRQATPSWVDRAGITAPYVEADRLTRETGVVHHVDHRVPICCTDRDTGEQIAVGLHVPWNLEPVPGVANLRKCCYVDRLALDAEQLEFSLACADGDKLPKPATSQPAAKQR